MPRCTRTKRVQSAAEAVLSAHSSFADGDPKAIAKLKRQQKCYINYLVRNQQSLTGIRRHDMHERCKHALCAPCHENRRMEESSAILLALMESARARPNAAVLALSFTSQPYSFVDATACVDAAIRTWQRFADRKRFKYEVDGYVRGITLVPDHADDTLRATINTVFVTSQDDQCGARLFKLWNDCARRQPFELSHHERIIFSDRDAQFALHMLAERVATLGLPPADLCEEIGDQLYCDPLKLSLTKAALRNRRMIYRGGVLAL